MKPARSELPREWADGGRQKLREAGFRDIESPCGIIKRRQLEGDRGEQYWARRNFLDEHPFASDLERSVWEMHTEDVSNREIAKRLQAENIQCYRQAIDRYIREGEALIRAQALGKARRRGRPRDERGRGKTCTRITLRLNEDEAMAYYAAKDRLGRRWTHLLRRWLLDLARGF